ncbi:uncharacterized protein LOC120179489 [Hibiscus syriacus]|uniref:uncharacterized protein LOC120179489 n=1 Tax=Hibiscus syriacus TaxID=106335 RepID=UPI001924BE17|nr:uncharacterized protein LOC120179489 [Hibiscus syriacus]
MAACRRWVMRVTSVFQAEATAALHAVQLALGMGFQEVVVEGDSKSIIEKLSTPRRDCSEVGALVWDVQRRSERFRSCSFLFTPRDSNLAAHILAAEERFGTTERVNVSGWRKPHGQSSTRRP